MGLHKFHVALANYFHLGVLILLKTFVKTSNCSSLLGISFKFFDNGMNVW